jgi:hypothetical protein
VLVAEVFMARSSTWVVGCFTGFSGHLASMVATWGFVDGCGWAVWGYVCGLDGCLRSGEDLTSGHLG